jgi:hypothetical protein
LSYRRPIFFLLIACAAIVWCLNAYTIIALFSPHPTAVSSVRKNNDDFLRTIVSRGDSALKCKPNTDIYKYDGSFEDPFRLLSEVFAPPAQKKAASPSAALTLALKGVLLKEQPLAILEDGTGKTFICGIGEKIQDNVVESIEANRVTLRGNQGKFTLSVKE